MPLTEDVAVRRKPTPQASATAVRRDQILDGAVAAFAERGFNASSMRDIANRIGMSHTGVQHHFPDKAALLEAVLDRRIDRAGRDLRADAHDGLAFLRGLITIVEQTVEDPTDLRMYRLVSAEALAPEHPAHGYQRHWYREVRKLAEIALRDLDARGHYAATDVPIEVAAVQIAGMRDGLDPQWLLDPLGIDLVGAVRFELQRYTNVPL